MNAAAGDLRLKPDSPAIDAGANGRVPADIVGLDGGGDAVGRMPLDLDGNPRFMDAPEMPDMGTGAPPVMDMGAY